MKEKRKKNNNNNNKKQIKQRQEKERGTEVIVKGREVNDFIVHLS